MRCVVQYVRFVLCDKGISIAFRIISSCLGDFEKRKKRRRRRQEEKEDDEDDEDERTRSKKSKKKTAGKQEEREKGEKEKEKERRERKEKKGRKRTKMCLGALSAGKRVEQQLCHGSLISVMAKFQGITSVPSGLTKGGGQFTILNLVFRCAKITHFPNFRDPCFPFGKIRSVCQSTGKKKKKNDLFVGKITLYPKVLV